MYHDRQGQQNYTTTSGKVKKGWYLNPETPSGLQYLYEIQEQLKATAKHRQGAARKFTPPS